MMYTAYGLAIHSDFELPELSSAPPGAAADLRILLDDQVPEALDGAVQAGLYAQARDGDLLLTVPEVACILVQGGREIRVRAMPGADAESVRLFVLGSGLGAALMQRGFLVIHGNAIEVDGACMICVGPSGAGKSTLAAGFLGRGYRVLADDVVPVDAQGRAWPGFPRIKLWQDAAAELAIDTEGFHRIRPGMDKFNVPVMGRDVSQPLPVKWVYELNPQAVEVFSMDQLKGMAKLPLIQQNTYRLNYVAPLGLQVAHFKQCTALAGQVRVARVTRPTKPFRLQELIDVLLEDAHAQA